MTAATLERNSFSASLSLPALRQELTLHPGVRYAEGMPTWTLQDPVANRFFRLNWLDFELLSRWHMGDAEAIIADIASRTTLEPMVEDVENLIKFLAANDLLEVRTEQGLERLREQAARARKRGFKWLLKNYLFMRFPLVSPQGFLDRTAPYLQWIWTRTFVVCTVLCVLVGVVLVLRQWDTFISTFPYFFSVEGFLTMALSLSVAKVMHELGHAYTAHRYGCRVPAMGVALLVLWPVLYTDATETWKLESRGQRLKVGAAGMTAELILAAYATLLWNFLPDGPLRSSMFLLATTTWLITLVINLNPFMRFDGYYLLSDSLGVANLQERAFGLARWRMRELLFSFGDPAPEYFPPHRARALLLYAYGTWVYRFFLFLGIALLVYHLFFKLLGIFLMLVELAWFIGRPLYMEFKEWIQRRGEISISGNARWTVLGLSLFLALLLVPWQSQVSAPALWRSAEYARFFVPSASYVETVNVSPGDQVQPGDILVQLVSPDLDYDIARGQKQLEILMWKVKFQGLDRQLLDQAPVSLQELQAETAAQRARIEEKKQLQLRSSVAGVITEMREPLSPGEWLKEGVPLALVVSREKGVVESYISEGDLQRVQVGQRGIFYPSDIGRKHFEIVVKAIDNGSTKQLDEPYLASTHGGPIAVRKNAEEELVPQAPIYRMELVPVAEGLGPEQVLAGTVTIEGERESVISYLARKVVSVLIRESGF